MAKKKAHSGFNGRKLRELRGAMSLADLAKLARVNRMDISRYERGLVVPSYNVACRLADALGVEVGVLRGARG